MWNYNVAKRPKFKKNKKKKSVFDYSECIMAMNLKCRITNEVIKHVIINVHTNEYI